MAPEIVQTQRESCFRGSHASEGACKLRVTLISKRLFCLRGRANHSEGVRPQIQVGEKHLRGLTDRCHDLSRLRGDVRSPGRIHLFQ